MTTTNNPGQLERETCSRCGGTGQHSYCQQYGTTCFKCCGRGWVLTKRGQAANQYLINLRSRRVDALKVGDQIKADFMGSMAMYTVESISADTSDSKSYIDGVLQPRRTDLLHIELSGGTQDGLTLYGQRPDTMFRMVLTREQQQATLTSALAYQETLTKQGKPRK